MRQSGIWRWTALWVCLTAWAALPAPAVAYLPSGAHAIDLMARYLGRPEALSVDQEVIIHPDRSSPLVVSSGAPEAPTADSPSPLPMAVPPDAEKTAVAEPAPITVTETLYYRFPHSFRSEARGAQTERIHLAVGGARLTLVDGALHSGREFRFDWYKDILLYRHPAWLGPRLASLGVDVHVVSLGRVDDTTILIIGARFPDRSRPQIWMDAVSYRPLRWILPSTGAEPPVEICYDRWAEQDGIRYPMVVVYRAGDRVLREIRVLRLRSMASAVLPPTIFDRQSLLQRADTKDIPDAQDRDRRIQQTIDDFGKRYQ